MLKKTVNDEKSKDVIPIFFKFDKMSGFIPSDIPIENNKRKSIVI
jgi:hypothetical protein